MYTQLPADNPNVSILLLYIFKNAINKQPLTFASSGIG